MHADVSVTVMELAPVTCPTCFEDFDVPLPGLNEVPAEVDYDCEVCCRPMIVSFWVEADEVIPSARSLDE